MNEAKHTKEQLKEKFINWCERQDFEPETPLLYFMWKRNEELREALIKYGHHVMPHPLFCKTHTPDAAVSKDCTCGLSQAIEDGEL